MRATVTSDGAEDRTVHPWVVAVVASSLIMLPLDYTVVAVALNALAAEFNAPFEALQWVVSGYTLAFGALLLAAGSIADRFGHRSVFIWGLWLFSVTSLVNGLAPSAMVLIVSRVAQGIAAALLFSGAVPLLFSAHIGQGRVRAFAIFGAVMGLGPALGPLLGGLLVESFSWRWIFLINVPIGLAMLTLVRLKVPPNSKPVSTRDTDWAGALGLSFTMGCLIFGLIHAGKSGLDAYTAAAVGCALLSAAGLTWHLRRSAAPILDISLLKNKAFLGANLPALTLSLTYWTVFLYFPLYYQNALGYSPLETGLAVLPFALPFFLFSQVGGRLATRISPASLLAAGQLIVASGLALLWWLATPGAGWQSFAGGALLAGTGTSLINGQMTNIAVSLSPLTRTGMASSFNGTLRHAGVALGFAALGVLLGDGEVDMIHTSHGLRSLLFLATIISLFSAMLTYRWTATLR